MLIKTFCSKHKSI